ncbi:hypothetical protein RN001_010350 [Aquatica leii]|uniref:Ribosomal RNA processing protein 1 homolog n=1 Tax=Aquatica leii TaxID=1421715 RepID=A0AAN7SFZ7_9COLE|nr:hypothetical protein RN001_010350 [Aquatica leii]
MGKTKEIVKDDEKQKLLITQDMKLVKALAGNEKKIRDRALRNLKEWFKQRSSKMPFMEDDYLRIWKGLFCSMWMSDKPLMQEECAENIASLIHFVTEDSALLFFKCGLQLMSIEWFGIDQWRLDKFLMLARRMLRHAFDFLKQHDWNVKLVGEFTRTLSQTVLTNNKCTGLTMHVSEIYLEELAKMSKGKISTSLFTEFLKPFIRYLSTSDDDCQIKHTIKSVFHHLMQQSDVGIEHEARFTAWKKEGFRGGSIDVMEKMDVDSNDDDDMNDDDDDERELDPRAGHVDVLLPQLKFDASSLLHLFKDFKVKKDSTTRGRKALTQLHQQFENLTKGLYPLGITKVPQIKRDDTTSVHTSMDRLADFEQQLRHEKKQFNKNLRNETPNKKPKTLNGFSSNIFADKLNEFINKSERNVRVKKIQPKKRRNSTPDPNWSFETSFRRNSGLWTVHRFNTTIESPVTTPNEWTPLEAGETEIFVPSQKFQAKMKAEGKDINEVVNKIMRTPNLVKNPFALPKRTPKSEKKVRIALKFNKSQEIHEHVAQLKSSPGIPFDATKKPEKPLLKPNFIKSPINPFYKKKLKM